MDATAPIDFEKSLIALFNFDKNSYDIHRFWQISWENGGYKENWHPLNKITKDGPEKDIPLMLMISYPYPQIIIYPIKSVLVWQYDYIFNYVMVLNQFKYASKDFF